MKYQTEYQRNYQNRTPNRFHELSAEERKLNEVPFKHTSPSRRRGRSLPSSPKQDNVNYTVIGPNDKFSQSQFYRLREPVKDQSRIAKSKEYAILGRNEKFENNVAYPLRKPVLSDSPRVVIRRRKNENHTCGIQTDKAARASFDPRYKRETASSRRRTNTQSEYKDKYDWKRPVGGSTNKQMYFDDSKLHDRRSDGYISSPEKTSVAVNTPARVEIDVNKKKHHANRGITSSKKAFRPKRDETTEYRTNYKPTINQKKPRIRKAYEAEEIHERKQREIPRTEHAYTDDEGTDLGNEFRQKYPHGRLRRWKSEYQSTYKPFWRFDYKNGKWYKDASADDKGFNPNLYWYKELMSARQRADNNRAKAEEDHFNRDHTLQLQTGFNLNNSYQAWDIHDYDDDDTDSVISIDRDLERERIEGERRREKDAQRNEQERIHYEKTYKKPTTIKTDQVAQTEHQTDRVVYIDDPPPKQPSAATKAFVRNLGSSNVQQQMSWDSESLYTQRTNSDLDYKSMITRDSHRIKHSPIKQKSIGTGMHSPIPTEQQQPRTYTNGYTSPKINQQNGANTNSVYPPASYQETTNATGRPSYDAHTLNKHPHTTVNEYCTYPGSRFKDEVTDYYYGGENNRQEQYYTPASKPSFQNHLQTLDDRYGQTYHTHHKDDDVLSARSLSSSCSLASQTLERAQQNMNKYWGDPSSSSPKKPSSAKH